MALPSQGDDTIPVNTGIIKPPLLLVSIDMGTQRSVNAVPPKDRVVISFGRGVPLAEVERSGLDLHRPAFH